MYRAISPNGPPGNMAHGKTHKWPANIWQGLLAAFQPGGITLSPNYLETCAPGGGFCTFQLSYGQVQIEIFQAVFEKVANDRL